MRALVRDTGFIIILCSANLQDTEDLRGKLFIELDAIVMEDSEEYKQCVSDCRRYQESL